MRRWIPLLLCLFLAGCGVSKDVYQTEVVRSQGLEARAADLDARLQAEMARRRSVEETLEARDAELETLKGSLQQMSARLGDVDAGLSASVEREAAMRADLDVCLKDRTATKGELQGCMRERDKLQGEIESCRSETAALEARIAVLGEQRDRTELEKREEIEELSKTYEGLVQGLKEEVEKGKITISQLRGRLSVNLLDEILFDSGSATVKPEGEEVLARLAELLAGVEDKAIVIEGHTDNVPISPGLASRFPSNWELSTARAASVVRYLQEAAGMAPEHLSAVGFGPYRPVASNDTPEGQARNRRIEVKLVPLEAPLFAPTTSRAP